MPKAATKKPTVLAAKKVGEEPKAEKKGGISAPLYDVEGKAIGTIDLPSNIFGVKWNADLVHQALVAIEANRRKPIAHTKMRGDVSGGGKKPWRQKGTGRARHGSIRSPLWRGGGVSHGPRNDKDYSVKINRKMRNLAVHAVLSKKLADAELRIVESFTLKEPKTKELFSTLNKFYATEKKGIIPSSLIVPAPTNKHIYRASSNLPRVMSTNPASLNVRDLVRHKQIVIEKEALAAIH